MRRPDGATSASTSPAASDHRPPLAGNATWRFAGTLARIGIGLVSVSIFTRVLGISQWGLLALFQAAVAPLALLDGLGRATVKYVSESLGRGDRRAAASTVRTALVLNLVLGAAGTAALLMSARWLAGSLFAIPAEDVDRATVGFRVMAGAWFVGVVTATYSGVLAAHQRYDMSAKLNTLALVFSTAVGLGTAAFTRDVVAVLVAQTSVGALMVVVYAWQAGRLLPEIVAVPRPDREALRRMVGFWRWEVVGVAGGLMTGWADRYILGAFFGPVAVGFYAVANLLQSHLYAAFLDVGEVLFPAVSHLEGRGELPAARRLTLLVSWAMTTGFGTCAVVLAVIGGDFLALWVSAEAARAATETLRVLCIVGMVALTAIGPLFYALGIGRTHWDAAAGILVGVTVTGLGLVLIPRYGLVGVGYGLLAGSLLRCGLTYLMWRYHFRPEYGLGEFALQVWAPALVSIGTLLVLTRWHDALGRPASWPWLFAEGALTLAVAAAVQLGISDLLPGGRQRRRDVVASFRPIVARAFGAISSRS